MDDLQIIKLTAKFGDAISVSASSVTSNDATIMLLSVENLQKYHDALDDSDFTVPIEFKQMATLLPDHLTVLFNVPENGDWHIMFQPSAVKGITANVISRRD